MLHVLLLLARAEEPVTSEQIGRMLNTNPSLVRRTMAGLREAGFVGSARGHGGGWVLEKPLTEIPLADVYAALDSVELLSLGRSEDTPACLLERAAYATTGRALEAARAMFQAERERVKPHAHEIGDHRGKSSGKAPIVSGQQNSAPCLRNLHCIQAHTIIFC
ncbi:Rrf2 family transcriptional regulator [Labrenzia sp. 011]|nr:Rrf2 family transcriptional regulator [Labrenzia sp. 011]